MSERKEKKVEHRSATRELLRKKAAEHYANNREEILRKKAEYRANNQEKIREQDRERYARNPKKAEQLREPKEPKKPPKFKYQAAFNKRVREEKRYYCEACDTACSKPSELRKHFETKKHVRNS